MGNGRVTDEKAVELGPASLEPRCSLKDKQITSSLRVLLHPSGRKVARLRVPDLLDHGILERDLEGAHEDEDSPLVRVALSY